MKWDHCGHLGVNQWRESPHRVCVCIRDKFGSKGCTAGLPCRVMHPIALAIIIISQFLESGARSKPWTQILWLLVPNVHLENGIFIGSIFCWEGIGAGVWGWKGARERWVSMDIPDFKELETQSLLSSSSDLLSSSGIGMWLERTPLAGSCTCLCLCDGSEWMGSLWITAACWHKPVEWCVRATSSIMALVHWDSVC